ncbi:MAG: purine-binding chemotaxis protein CheW [Phycisphaerae bacterium]|nr:purine-binding chemotaxis protein CheW [Phycisphaerae bacterium]
MATTLERLKTSSSIAGKYLTFALGKEEYGLQILKVKEIIGYQDITSVPQTPPEIKGVINLRGKVIPIVDLRTRFSMEEVNITEQTCIIVIEIEQNDNTLATGIVVDNVSEVLDITAEEIEPAPEFGSSLETNFILGMGKVGGKVKILLDIEKALIDQNLMNITDIYEDDENNAEM